ncbi:PREDICTED: IQ motif and SEC7 domain-containing protein 3-like isoform X3 [Poecilia mexicana]|uniref:IQ motif and SEC7 domain-containing protein 3-like isoform X3 n=1 Tax=Poecilia mexicana TaxID=48701 RepID=UPI00072ECA19|nr:PREDICTED: IQ motif and SEC7 domain-containing protein 3-like isoform X3 [Poecilia mexicana]
MESLLDNPMKAVLYLKELTTIVQNQQSLIQTQRQRIDELERKVEDLIGENRQLRDPHLYVQQPPSQHHHHHQHHQHPTQRSASPQAPAHLHQHPGSATKAAAHLGQQLPPPPQQQQQQPPPPQQQQIVHQTAQPQQQQQQQQHPTPTAPSSHHPQQLQLVPTSPQSPKVRKAGSESAEDDKRSACCKSLVPQTPSTLCRSVGLARKADNQTVLHQFCCPAPEAPEAETSTACVPSDELSPDSSVGQEGKGGEGEPQGEDQPQPEPEPPQPEQQEQKHEPQTLPSQPQPEPEPQAEPQPQLDVEPQSEPEPEPSPEPDPQPQDESVTDDAPQDPPEAPSPCREEKMAVEAENHKSEEVAEAKTRHERDEVQGESSEGKPTQGEEDEEEGGAKGGGAGRRASLHHTASPLRVQRNGAGSHSASSDYELSLDLKTKQIEMLEHKYGGHLISRHAACKIQTAFRQYQLSKNFEKIRNSLLESRLPRRISLRKVRVQNTEGFSAERALAEGCNLAGIPLVRSPSLPASVGSTLTDLEDSFTEQVQSLAKSIDDALSNWSLKTMCSLQEGGTYQFSTDSFNAAAAAASGVEEGGEGGNVGQAAVHQGTVDPSDLSRSASKLMMAFRDVTVQIDSQNFRVSSSVMESSTSVTLGSCIQQGASTFVTTTSSTTNSTPPPLTHGPSDEPPPPEAPTEPIDAPPPPQEPPPPPAETEIEDDEQEVEFPAPPPSEEVLSDETQPPLTPLDKMSAIQSMDEVAPPPPPPPPPTEPAHVPVPQEPPLPRSSPMAEPLDVKRCGSETADNSSEQMSSSSTSTEARSTSEASSKEALQAMILSLPRYHCENPASCKSPTLSTDVMRKRLYRIGLNLFNLNPDKGLQFLISRGFIPDTPIGVAHFLLQRKGLSRQMIGEFLGNSKKPFNRDVLDCVVDEMDFSGMELDEALRKFQAHIRVQGEAQKVERLIEAFSQRYCMCNPDVVQQFHNPDTIFILAFAIILLNTDMYSPNIKPDRKMLLEDFIRNLRGVDDGADIPRDMVVGIYERIQLRELRSNEDHVTYVSKVEQSIVGMKTVLSVPHRRLVCCSRLFEVTDVNKAQKQAAHQREVFLFNDLIVILKLCPKKKSSAAYTFCKALGLLGMQFHLFENEYYPHGITILSPYGSDKKQVLHFCAQSAEELLKFVEDLKESIAEVSEMEQIRIEWELEKQQGAKTHSVKSNGTQLELRSKQGSLSGVNSQQASDVPAQQQCGSEPRERGPS